MEDKVLPRQGAEVLVRRLKAALADMAPAECSSAYNQVFGVLVVLELAVQDPDAVLRLGDE